MIGFDATVRTDDTAPVNYKENEIKSRTRILIISAIFSLPLLWTMVAHFKFTSGLYVPELFMYRYMQ